MKKWIIIIIMVLLGMNLAYSCKELYNPNENVIITDIIESYGEGAFCNLSIYHNDTFILSTEMERNGLAYNYSAGVLSKGTYKSNIECNLSNSTFLGECNFIIEGEDDMAGLAIMMFTLLIPLGLFILPFVKQFSKSEVLNMIFKRACWVLSLFLFMLNSYIAVEIAETAGIEVSDTIMNVFSRWLGIAGYLMMAFLVLSTLIQSIMVWKKNKKQSRVGI